MRTDANQILSALQEAINRTTATISYEDSFYFGNDLNLVWQYKSDVGLGLIQQVFIDSHCTKKKGKLLLIAKLGFL